MTHTFKLARRMSRLRLVPLISGLLVAAACTEDMTEPTSLESGELAADASTPSLATSGAASVSVSGLSVGSGKTYRVVPGLAAGSKMYTDRAFTLDGPIPSAVAGLTYIQTANDDKNAKPGTSSFLSFDVSANATIYVAHDNRVARPSWLTSSYQDTGTDLVDGGSETRLSLFRRSVARGRVTLGSNVRTSAVQNSMYLVLVAAAGTQTVTPPPPAVEAPVTGTGRGIPFGASSLPVEQYANTAMWSGALRHLSPNNSAITELAAAKRHGARVVISMAGGRPSFKNADGTFSMSKWKTNVSKWRAVNIAPYITDGTIVGHYLIDEPQWPGSWGGRAISFAELEEMARFSKSIWPTMATTIRSRPADLKGGSWQHLDFAWAQWEGPLHGASRGISPEVWRDRQSADAKSLGLKLMFGMNFLDGGDGSSRIAGTYNLRTHKDRWQMTAAEVERVGKVLAAATYGCGVISWQWSPIYPSISYFTAAQWAGVKGFNHRSDVKTALARVAAVAKNRSATSCRK